MNASHIFNIHVVVAHMQLSVPSPPDLVSVLNCVAGMKIVLQDRSAAPMDVAMCVQPYRIVL